MVNLMTYAGSRGETLREFLNYCYKRTHNNQKCRDGSIEKAMKECTDNPYKHPDFVSEWFARRRLRV